MDLQPIDVSWKEARETLKQYGSVLREKRTEEDLAILKSTKAILAGKIVIRLADAVKNGGVDDRGLPRIAVSRADDRFVKCRSHGVSCEMSGTQTKSEYIPDYHHKRGSWGQRLRQAKPRGFRFDLTGKFQDRCEAVACVPSIPPAFRPSPSAYGNYYVLFEAEWDVSPPIDPALLAPLGGGLYAVVAMWNLTEVEQAVLADSRGLR